jgi:hypothetical protein
VPDLLHIDGDGARLQAGRWCHAPGATLSVDNGSLVDVSAGDLPGVVAKLYEACGLPSPVILERPAVPEGEEWKPDGNSLLRVSRDRDRLTVRTTMDGGAAVLSPVAARAMAGVLAALAGEAEAEPDPTEVDDLAAAIRAEFQGDGTPPTEWEKKTARAALRWFKNQESRDA